MFKEITIKEARDLCESAGTFALNSIRDIGLCEYPRYYKIEGAFQDVSKEDVQALIAQLKASTSPSIPDGCNCTVVFEAKDCSMAELDEIFTWATNCLGEHRVQRFEPVILYEAPFAARITVLCHRAQHRRYCHSEINRQSRLLLQNDLTLSKTLDAELSRNDEIVVVKRLGFKSLWNIISDKHLLWTSIASTTRSQSEMIERMKPEMAWILDEYDVSDLILFIETDKGTPLEEVDALRRRFKKIVGKGVHIHINLRAKDSFIKVITCRAVLVGTPRFEKGLVYEDHGQYEILLFESDNQECGHGIAAIYTAEGLFTLCRWDWGAYAYNRLGQTDDRHYFDDENTRKLFEALHVKKPEAFLRTLRRRFASRFPSSADSNILDFCRKEGIQCWSDYHY